MRCIESLKQAGFGLMVASAVVLGGAAIAGAQDAAVPSHPAHIHAGNCAELDPNPAAPLVNVTVRGADDEDDGEETPVAEGALTAPAVLYSDSEDVELKWDDMLAEGHAINVHESDENIQNYIACGDIGGVVVDDKLVIALHPQNDSGYSGIAILEKDDDGNVDVEIYLAEPGVDSKATPVA